jgi:catechol 2,3-dioxygenase-like lactoylglutathione lyase family enzyme
LSSHSLHKNIEIGGMSMVPQRVSLITIGAINLPELRSFYQKLGWSETAISSDNYCVFETAGVLLSLFPLNELAKDAGMEVLDKKNGFSGLTLAINVDRPEDVDKTINEIREAGGRIVREPSDAFWGGRTAYFLDPENNAWEVAWNPTAVFDERGAMITF